MTEGEEQWICIKFCVKLEHSSVETIWMIQKVTAMGSWWLAASSQHPHSCVTSPAEFLVKHLVNQVTQFPYSPDLVSCKFWLFSRTKITFEREDISGHRWDSGKYDKAADDNSNKGFCRVFWTVEEMLKELYEIQGAYFEGNWGVIVLCTMFLVSCIFFNKCLYFSYVMAG